MDQILFTPGPTRVPGRVLAAMTRPLIGHRTEDFRQLYKSVKEKFLDLFNLGEYDVLFVTSSGTGAVEAMISTFTAPGEKYIVPVYGTFSMRAAETLRVHGVEAEIINLGYNAPRVGVIEEKLAENRYDGIMIVHNETSPGITVREIGRIADKAREKGLTVLVDAVSSLGGIVLEPEKWGIHAVASATQKCLASPPGLGIVVVSPEAWKKGVSTSYYLDLRKYRSYDAKSETPFTPSISLFYALDQGLSYIREVGLEKWILNHDYRARALYSSLEILGFEPFVKEEDRSPTVISLKCGNCRHVRERLAREYGIVTAGGFGELREKMLRIGNMGIISASDLRLLVSAISAVSGRGGVLSSALEMLEKHVSKMVITPPW